MVVLRIDILLNTTSDFHQKYTYIGINLVCNIHNEVLDINTQFSNKPILSNDINE